MAYLLLVVLLVGIVFRIAIALEVPGKVSSWWRTPWHNKEVGGVANSRHLFGWAWDVTPKNQKVGQALRNLFAMIPTAEIIDEGSHYHVELV